MKRKILAGVGLFIFIGLSQIAFSAAEDTWVPLFNGKDLAGWTPMHDAAFLATNGNLRLIKSTGWLRSEKEYADFILEFETRALEDQFDSGVLLRAGLEGKPWPTEGWQVNLSFSSFGGLMKGPKILLPAEARRPDLNQWVKFHIEAKGNKITLTVDDEPNWTFEQADRPRGYIGIQAENKSFEFRNIRLRELK
jgi:hypothetical protein